MDPIITIITKLLTLAVDLEPVLVKTVEEIKGQTGLTTAQVFDHASAALDDNEKALAADIAAKGGTAE